MPTISANTISIRTFARDSKVRKKAHKANQVIILENHRGNESPFLLFPAAMQDDLFALYQDMRDAELLKEAIKNKSPEFFDWEDVKFTLDEPPARKKRVKVTTKRKIKQRPKCA